MVIADLDKSGWSVFSWAVIADLSFESLRFARWVFSHLSPLCSRLWSGQSHQATFICSSHLFTKNTQNLFSLEKLNTLIWPQGIAILPYNLKSKFWLLNWFSIDEGTTGQQTFRQEDVLSGWHFVRMAGRPWTFCQDYAWRPWTFCQDGFMLDVLSGRHFVSSRNGHPWTFCQDFARRPWKFCQTDSC